MPSSSVLERKKQEVEKLSARLKDSVSGVFVNYVGITVEKDTVLRRQCRSESVEYSVVKNTLLSLAAKQVGLEGLVEVFHGTTSLATSFEDVISPAKVLVEFSENNEILQLKGGFVNGRIISVEEIKELASVSSKEVLLSRMLGSLIRPFTELAIALKAVADLKAT